MRGFRGALDVERLIFFPGPRVGACGDLNSTKLCTVEFTVDHPKAPNSSSGL